MDQKFFENLETIRWTIFQLLETEQKLEKEMKLTITTIVIKF